VKATHIEDFHLYSIPVENMLPSIFVLHGVLCHSSAIPLTQLSRVVTWSRGHRLHVRRSSTYARYKQRSTQVRWQPFQLEESGVNSALSGSQCAFDSCPEVTSPLHTCLQLIE
jgi:hypothetical protein